MGETTRPKFAHEADEYFVSLVDYLRHLVDRHGVEETPELWRSGRDTFDAFHATAHDAPASGAVSVGGE
ncbi:MAG TPA: hypothetical protein VFB19_18500 [Mycobacterium sp.]|nr:hypothetical protein [Mycobacterium sp.]